MHTRTYLFSLRPLRFTIGSYFFLMECVQFHCEGIYRVRTNVRIISERLSFCRTNISKLIDGNYSFWMRIELFIDFENVMYGKWKIRYRNDRIDYSFKRIQKANKFWRFRPNNKNLTARRMIYERRFRITRIFMRIPYYYTQNKYKSRKAKPFMPIYCIILHIYRKEISCFMYNIIYVRVYSRNSVIRAVLKSQYVLQKTEI